MAWCTALEVSSGSVVIDGQAGLTWTFWETRLGCRVTLIWRTEMIEMVTAEWASAKPLALAVTSYAPAGRSTLRNSPCASVSASRARERPGLRTEILAEGTRAPLESRTVPSSQPCGFCSSAGANTTRPSVTTKSVQRVMHDIVEPN